ncbi:MAG TPA: nucleotidyl transferase AbiEii/AbiGii toxin family protein [Spirochaetota bacterium]|nr:nucleotidyl transferase AbiEii/AbiGii toxin family protein [Spirochaetota bacterium]HOL55949.1 nucleotidyl transferase AbiEii/AbiGii toxin family protein [Spirochaetota bacterium]
MEIDYKKLYKLQDEIFIIFNDKSINFYLTGGTCLHRFYSEKRYSEYLDFFCNDNNLFREYIYQIKKILEKNIEVVVDTKDFVRLQYDILKIDLVNERSYYYGEINIKNNIKIDNIKNILANKIGAICSRDEPKDIVDLCTIFDFITIEWDEIFEIVNKKMNFNLDFFLYRLKVFPEELFEVVNFKDKIFEKKCYNILKDIIKQIESL